MDQPGYQLGLSAASWLLAFTEVGQSFPQTPLRSPANSALSK